MRTYERGAKKKEEMIEINLEGEGLTFVSREAIESRAIIILRIPIKILVVDDDAEIRRALSKVIVNEFGAEIVMGINGQDGWREFQESQPDLVITDLRMETQLAGIELAEKIKAASPATPVIMITGEDINRVEAVDCLIKKPFDGEDLVEKIKELLEGR